MSSIDLKEIVKRLYEWGSLKTIPRSGWLYIGMKNPETVAEHALRAAQVGYILAKLEHYPEPEKVATALVFHEIGETRTGDLTLLGKKYLPKKNEIMSVKDQIEKLFPEIVEWVSDLEEKKGDFGKILKDADLLENALTAKEYIEQGYKKAEQWLKNIKKRLQTKSGKKLFEIIISTDPYFWWEEVNN